MPLLFPSTSATSMNPSLSASNSVSDTQGTLRPSAARLASSGPSYRNALGTPSTSSRPSTPMSTSQSAPQGLRAQLHHLLPRHALFNVHLCIHEISSVPLVHGEFGVKWKFKNTQSNGGGGLLSGLRKGSGSKGKGKDTQNHDANGISPHNEGDADDDMERDSMSFHSQDMEASFIPSVVVSSHHHAPSIGSNSSSSNRSISIHSITTSSHHSHQSHPNSSTSSSSNSNPRPALPSRSTTGSWSLMQSGLNSSSSEYPPPPPSSSPSRGITLYSKLQDHGASWEHSVNVMVKMDVERDTSDLLPNELKLVVMQRVIPGDPGAPQNPRLGSLILNLAEYADPSVGPITRSYLLNESKTNAVLKLTIHVTQHPSDKTIYRAPPLPKGEILSGISKILEESDAVYETRPVALTKLFEGIQEQNLQQHSVNHQAPPLLERPSFRNRSSHSSQFSISGPPPKFFYDTDKLPYAYGPQSTQDIIEALFNPAPTTSAKEVSPFTYYVEPKEYRKAKMEWKERAGGLGLSGMQTMHENVQQGGHVHGLSASMSSGGASVEDYDLSASLHAGQRGKWWARTPKSRPTTPVV